MLADDPDLALAHLDAAAARGSPDLAGLETDPLFAPLATDPARGPRFAAILARPAPPAPAPLPAPVVDGAAEVSAANTVWNPVSERLEPRFDFAAAPSAPVLPARPEAAAYDLLREHVRRGRAAGNHGDLFDNRDRGHSTLERAAHPQLAHVTYSPAARAADIDYGLNDRVLFDRPTFGNSSTAVTDGALWRSLPRLAMTRSDGSGPLRLWQNVEANHLYIHPAHKDFGEDFGDLFPANTPYLLVSRGSSGSDRPFMEAVAMIFAAFRPDTKDRLVAEHMLVPTAQMVFRRSLHNVTSRESYFSGDAHPAAFEGYQINLARMVSLANSIEPDAIPAEARIAVLEEELGTEGLDYFGEGLSEQLFDTPQAIARIWRSRAWQRSMLLSAEASRDANDRPLEFHWRLLQGDPERVRIEPLDGGARARVTLDWHDPFEISEEVPLTTARVDIGVFASNGVHDSAPAILSWYFPPQESRRYAPGPDGAMRIAAIDYADPQKAETYADPMLIPRANWRDEYRYAPDGTPAGWIRFREGRDDAFTPEGLRILTRDAAGAPATVEAVAYPLRRTPEGGFAVDELSTGRILDYAGPAAAGQ
ncbi:MAG TPA: hypothetical protein PKA33_04670 [Amaricoccus sp.]|uniref:hypothetical protein n=1 Tax=Amaricoccus sp. TaxID=1872485 RepID=UPI002C1DBE9A|nr:hypothetical protein [Amaricoccus sp.]HMR51765.1 hypothetical protein [Amaricoccus sp.]HMT98649.1 hypothetical protein [Amaricoccus sp.]